MLKGQDLQDRIRQLESQYSELRRLLQTVPARIGIDAAEIDTIIVGRVNAPGGTSAATFPVDDHSVVSPPAPASSEITVQNTKSWSFNDNEIVLVFRNSADGKYYVVKLGEGSAGLVIDEFELTQNLTLSATSATAHIVDDDGNETAIDINALDPGQRWYGLADYTGATGNAERGYRGWGLKITDDYNGTGNPGYRIIELEGPATSITVELKVDISGTGQHEAEYVKANVPVQGSNQANKMPEGHQAGGTGSYTRIHVVNTLETANNAKKGEEWIADWSVAESAYVLVSPVAEKTHVVQIKTTISEATITNGTITPGTGTAQVMKRDVSTWVDDTDAGTITVENHSETPVTVTDTPICLRAKRIDGVYVLDNWDMRSLSGYVKNDAQVPVHQRTTGEFSLTSGYDLGKNQFVGHDLSANVQWLDLTEEQIIVDYDHPNKEFDTKDIYGYNPHNVGTISIDTSTC